MTPHHINRELAATHNPYLSAETNDKNAYASAAHAAQAAFTVGFGNNVWVEAQRRYYDAQARHDSSQQLSEEEFNESYSVGGMIPWRPGTSRRSAEILLANKRAELLAEENIDPDHFVLNFAGGMAGSMTHWIDMLTMVAMPHIGWAKGASKAGGSFLRNMPRYAWNGAMAGAVDAAWQVPAMYELNQHTGTTYTGYDALVDMVASPVFGSVLATGTAYAGHRLSEPTRRRAQARALVDMLEGELSDEGVRLEIAKSPEFFQRISRDRGLKKFLDGRVDKLSDEEVERLRVHVAQSLREDGIFELPTREVERAAREVDNNRFARLRDTAELAPTSVEQSQLASLFTDLFGVQVRFVDGAGSFVSMRSPDTLFVGKNLQGADMATAAMHEYGHSLRIRDPETWRGVVDVLTENPVWIKIDGKEQDLFRYAFRQVEQRYNDSPSAPNFAELSMVRQVDEAVAHALAVAAEEPAFWRQLAKRKPGAFQQVIAFMKQLVEDLLNRFGHGSDFKQWEPVIRKLADAIAKADPEAKAVAPRWKGGGTRAARELYAPLMEKNRQFLLGKTKGKVETLKRLEDMADFTHHALANDEIMVSLKDGDGEWVAVPEATKTVEVTRSLAGFMRQDSANQAGKPERINTRKTLKPGEFGATRETPVSRESGFTDRQLSRLNQPHRRLQATVWKDGQQLWASEWDSVKPGETVEIRYFRYDGGELRYDETFVAKYGDRVENEIRPREETDYDGAVEPSEWDAPDSLGERLRQDPKRSKLKDLQQRRHRYWKLMVDIFRKELQEIVDQYPESANPLPDSVKVADLSEDELLNLLVFFQRTDTEQFLAREEAISPYRQAVARDDALDHADPLGDFDLAEAAFGEPRSRLDDSFDDISELPGSLNEWMETVENRARALTRRKMQQRIDRTLSDEKRLAMEAAELDSLTIDRQWTDTMATLPESLAQAIEADPDASNVKEVLASMPAPEQDLVRQLQGIQAGAIHRTNTLVSILRETGFKDWAQWNDLMARAGLDRGRTTQQLADEYQQLSRLRRLYPNDSELAEAMRERATRQYRTEQIDRIRHYQVTQTWGRSARASRSPVRWLASQLDGLYRGEAQGRVHNLDSRRKERVNSDTVPLENVLEATGLWDEFQADRLTPELLRYLENEGQGDFEPEIARIGEVIRNTYKSQLAALRKAGVHVDYRQGFALSHRWDPATMRRVGLERFRALAHKHFDWERIEQNQGGLGRFRPEENRFEAFDPEAYIEAIYEDVVNGHERPFQAVDPEVDGANLGRRLTHARTIELKKGSTFAMMKELGGSDTVAQMLLGQIERRAETIPLIEAFGPRPQHTFEAVKSLAGIAYDRPHPNAGILGKLNHAMEVGALNATFKYLTGELDHPVSRTIAEWGQMIRKWSNVAFLGKSGISALTDQPMIFDTLNYMGMPMKDITQRYHQAVSRAVSRDPEARIAFRAMGAAADSLRNALLARLGLGEAPGRGALARANKWMFNLNGLNFLTDTGQKVFADLATQLLAEAPIEALAPALSRLGIDPAKFAELRKQVASPVPGLGEVTRLAPDMLLDADPQMARNLRVYMQDFMRQAVLEPGARTQAMVRMGLPAGTISGEAVRMAGHYLTFPLAITHKTYGRLRHGYGDIPLKQWLMNPSNRTVIHTMALSAAMLAMSYVVMGIKDVLQGREPIALGDLFKPQNFSRWIDQSGVGGIAVPLLTGRALSPMADLVANPPTSAYQGAVTAQQLTPFSSLPVIGVSQDPARAFFALVLGDALWMHYERNLQNRLAFIERNTGQESIFRTEP